MPFLKKFLLAIFAIQFALSSVSVFSQQSGSNIINLGVPFVTKDGKAEVVKKLANNSFQYDGELSKDDSIRYSWSGVDLDTRYATTAAKAGGYLKIYLNDDTKDENLIANYGSSPLPISVIASKLKEGENKILMVFIDYTGKAATPATKVLFSFKFKNLTNNPQIKVLSPAENVIFMKDLDRDINLELQNFVLEMNNSNDKNKGKLNVYYNEVKESNWLATINTSKDLGDNKSQVVFSSKDTNFSKIPDSKDTKLVFVLTKTTGELLEYKTELKVRTNYNNTLVLDFPKITILEPRKDRTNLSIDGDQKFILNIQNFEMLSERQGGDNVLGKGYLQILVDGVPMQIIYPNSEFSLNDIKYSDIKEARKNIRVQLVNKDFSKLSPEASDNIDVIYVPKVDQKTASEPAGAVQNNIWRIVIIVLTIVLVVGGVAVIVTKG